jgi:hypothetical protein
VLVIAIGLGVGIYWIASHGGAFMEKSKQSAAEGERFGRETDNQGCVTETIVRHKQNSDLSGMFANQLFLAMCLQRSKATPGFCEVPKRTEFIKSAEWQTEQCARNDLHDNYCRQIFAQVQIFCERKKKSL